MPLPDPYLSLMRSPVGRPLSQLVGMPTPPRLQRALGGYLSTALKGRRVQLGSSSGAQATSALLRSLRELGAELTVDPHSSGSAALETQARELGVETPQRSAGQSLDALIYDATGIVDVESLGDVHAFFQASVGRLSANARVLLLGLVPELGSSPMVEVVDEALGGFVRSLARELGRTGSTVNRLRLATGADRHLDGALRYLLTPHAAFVSGQALTLRPAQAAGAVQPVMPLLDRVAVVTGAARGIGASIAATLAREGARVIGVDRAAEEPALTRTLSAFGGQPLLLDVCDPRAAERIAETAGGIDVLVHNAGITRDRSLRKLAPSAWKDVLQVNLAAVLRIDQQLLAGGFNTAARIVCVSSVNGMAGAAGQTHYAASKAGLIGHVRSLSAEMARRGGAINAVAPGFIDTRMTAQIPLVQREFGRRFNALLQGGEPIDVAEAVTFLASPLAHGVNGEVLRVCGHNFVGA